MKRFKPSRLWASASTSRPTRRAVSSSELGLADDLASTAIATSTLGYFNKHGQKIWSEPRGRAAGYNWPQYSIHRGEFLMLLARAVRARIGDENFVLGHHLDLRFEEDGKNRHRAFHRPAQRQAYSHRGGRCTDRRRWHSLGGAREAAPQRRRAAFRRHADVARGGGDRAVSRTGVRRRSSGIRAYVSVAYPNEQRGGTPQPFDDQLDRGNCACLAARRRAPIRNKRVDKSAFAHLFKDWKFPWLDVPAIIDATEAIYEFPKSTAIRCRAGASVA